MDVTLSGCDTFWISQIFWMSNFLNVKIFGSQTFWMSHFFVVSLSGCQTFWISKFLDVPFYEVGENPSRVRSTLVGREVTKHPAEELEFKACCTLKL